MKTDPKLRRPPFIYRMMHALTGPFSKALGLSCRDAFELCSVQMDRELTRGESFRLRFHLLACGICRHLPAQFRGLRALVRACEHEHEHGVEEAGHEQLPPEVKKRIAEHLINS